MAGIISFYLLRADDTQTAKEIFMKDSSYNCNAMNNVINMYTDVMQTMRTFMFLNPHATYTEYLEFAQESGCISALDMGIHSISYATIVNDTYKDTFINNTRKKYKDKYEEFTTFHIYNNDTADNFTLAYEPLYFPIMYVAPREKGYNLIGWYPINGTWLYSGQGLNQLWRAYNQTEFLSFSVPGVGNTTLYGFVILLSVGDLGVLEARLTCDLFVKYALWSEFMENSVTLITTNGTENPKIMYTSDEGSNQRETYQYLRDAPFYSLSNLTIVSEHFNVISMPTQEYLDMYVTPKKWIVLVLCITSGLFLSVVISISVKRVLYMIRGQRSEREKIQFLQKSHIRLKELLDRISEQERRARTTMNAIRDYMVIINLRGRILQTNKSFDKVFMNDLTSFDSDQLFVSSLFPNLSETFFDGMNSSETIETEMAKRSGGTIKVRVRVTCFDSDHHDDQTFNDFDELLTEDVTKEKYLIVARNLESEESIIEEKRTQESIIKDIKKKEFDAQFKMSSFRKAFYVFLKPTQSHLKIAFLEKLLLLRRVKDIDAKLKMQNDIYEKFLKKESENFIGLSDSVSEHYSVKSRSMIGDVDFFKEIEELIKDELIKESYDAFMNQTK
ncbi:nifL [Acrasis kona]|uniref:NifL n=1 Tax=Acrasis kona TaxID=1008807 RepID=A0AAW2YU90_9EUKA